MFRVTPHVEYSFTDPSGHAHSRDVMMNKDDWDELVFAKTIPVEYLPSDPEWNRPVQRRRFDKPRRAISLDVGAMSLVFAFFCVTSFLGYDLKSESGVTRLTRGGTNVRQWGTAKSKPTLGLSDHVIVLDEDEPEHASPGSPQFPQPTKPSGLSRSAFARSSSASSAPASTFSASRCCTTCQCSSIWNGIDAVLAIALIVVARIDRHADLGRAARHRRRGATGGVEHRGAGVPDRHIGSHAPKRRAAGGDRDGRPDRHGAG